VVQALAKHADGRGSVEAFREAFIGRLQVLASAHGLLFERQWLGADLQRLTERVLEPYRADRADRIVVAGEPVVLIARQGLALSLVLHELATNAAKYGALACDAGRIEVAWQVRADSADRFYLIWQELGGPPVEPPQEQGFGTQLIKRAITYELQGEVELDYATDGLRCQLTFPLA
jgi:two-component sensor histidine kinase